MRLTVVIPVFNECATILDVLDRVSAVDLDKEIIVVDDCSTDGTRDLLQERGTTALRLFFTTSTKERGPRSGPASLKRRGISSSSKMRISNTTRPTTASSWRLSMTVMPPWCMARVSPATDRPWLCVTSSEIASSPV